MRICETSITVSRTLNLGVNRPSSMGINRDSDHEEDDMAAARERMLAEVRESLAQSYKAFCPKQGGQT